MEYDGYQFVFTDDELESIADHIQSNISDSIINEMIDRFADAVESLGLNLDLENNSQLKDYVESLCTVIHVVDGINTHPVITPGAKIVIETLENVLQEMGEHDD